MSPNNSPKNLKAYRETCSVCHVCAKISKATIVDKIREGMASQRLGIVSLVEGEPGNMAAALAPLMNMLEHKGFEVVKGMTNLYKKAPPANIEEAVRSALPTPVVNPQQSTAPPPAPPPAFHHPGGFSTHQRPSGGLCSYIANRHCTKCGWVREGL